jgi:serine protease AprX
MTQETRRGGARRRAVQRLLALLAVVVLLAGIVPPASAAPDRDGSKLDSSKVEPALQRALTARPNEKFKVIVTRVPPKDKNERRGRIADIENEVRGEGGQVTRRLGLVEGHAVTLNARGIARLSRNNKVKTISLDHQVDVNQISTVPLIGSALGTVTLQSTNVSAINAPQVWSQGNTGQGISVAVLDSGIAANPDLPTAVFGVDVVNHTTTLGDKGGHGTHVAGIIAGNGTQSAGAYKGVAPGARVVSVKVTDDQGRASYSSIISGIAWIIFHQKAYNIRVANISLGARSQGSYADDPLDAAVEALWFRGITVVASAGNGGPGAGTIGVPGNDPFVITVGAFDDGGTTSIADDRVPDWTSRGPTAFDNVNKPDLAASGRKIVSLRSVGSLLDLSLLDRVVNTKYFRLSGTSMSTPAVSGVVALMLVANPNLTPNQIKAILAHTARPVAGAPATAVGAGMVDAAAAVQLARYPYGMYANRGLTPSSGLLKVIWPIVKQNAPKWRYTGSWMGRYWVNGSWDLTTGFKSANGSWDDAGWDLLAAANLDWDGMAWSDAGWDSGGWDDSGWDDSGWDDSGWDNGGWNAADAID